MKKYLLLTFAILLSMPMMAQNRSTLIKETFDVYVMPTGWTFAGDGTSNWMLSITKNAGGSPFELNLKNNPQFEGTARFVSPAVDLTGVSRAVVMFKHYLSHSSGVQTLGVATSSDDGATWNIGWSQDYSATGQHNVMQNITTPDMGKDNVKFCIFFTGDNSGINDWFFDDIEILSLEDSDLEITSINIDNFVGAGDVPVSFNVINYGSTTITSIEANYQFGNLDMVTETFDVNIANLESQTINFTNAQNLIFGEYTLTINVSLVNGEEDDNMDNNTISKDISIISLCTTQKIPMIEHFSSSTCLPCTTVNSAMVNFTNNNPGKYTYTKYAMNWPGVGDPYYTSEGGTRRTYYVINGVPQTRLDGMEQLHAAFSQEDFDKQYYTPAFADIKGAFNVEGNTITITADVITYIDIDNTRVFVSVNEKTTHNNIGDNGETEFHHIMMKMFPNAQGTTTNLNAGESTRLEFTYDMSTTNVEEMSDLEVSVWLQNYDTKEIYNSRFLYEYTDHPYPVRNLQMTKNEDNNTITISYDTPEAGNPTGYNVYMNSVLVAENTNDLEYTFPAEPGNLYVAEVYANYEDDKTSIKSVVGYNNPLSIEDNMIENHCSIYPNPANNHVNIVNNTEISTISIFNCVGTLVDRIEVRDNSFELNTSKYDTGVYFMNIMNVNGQSSSKKLVVVH